MNTPTSMTAPEAPSNFMKVDPIPAKRHLCILFQIVDMGTKEYDTGQWGLKPQRKVRLSFEFPNETRVFREGDDPAPSKLNRKFTFTLTDGSNLTKFVNGALGRKMDSSEYKTFNMLSLLGKQYITKIIHEPKKDNSGESWTNMQTCELVKEGDREDFANLPFDTTKQVNPSFVFIVDEEGKCFGDEAFGKIYGETRKAMLQSDQCIFFINNGGTVFANPKWDPDAKKKGGGTVAEQPTQQQTEQKQESAQGNMKNPTTFL